MCVKVVVKGAGSSVGKRFKRGGAPAAVSIRCVYSGWHSDSSSSSNNSNHMAAHSLSLFLSKRTMDLASTPHQYSSILHPEPHSQ